MTLNEIKGIGSKRIAQLNKAGIFTPVDLLMHFPYNYVDTSKKIDFNKVPDGEQVAFVCNTSSEPTLKYVRKGLNMLTVEVDYFGRKIRCVWFNQPFIKRKLLFNKKFIVVGKVSKFKNSISVTVTNLLDYNASTENILPLYKNVNKVPATVIADAIRVILKQVVVSGYLASAELNEFGIEPTQKAFVNIHMPKSIESALSANKSVTIEHLSYLLTLYSLIKNSRSGARALRYVTHNTEIDEAIATLPFKLTDDQLNAVSSIISGFHSTERLNMLIQGDVGCGKTIVALLATYYAKLSGYQSVIMAPTDLLARQHYSSAINVLERLGVKVALLTGSLTKKQRDEVLFNTAHGGVDVIIGTHAVIQHDVSFYNLGLVITDEQHRFGVNQRATLEEKANNVDTIVMSATPIPRTLALTLYGDLEQVVIRAFPKGKAKTHTRMVPVDKKRDMLKYVVNKAKNGEQTYIVCPRIETDDGLLSVDEVYDEMKKFATDDVVVARLHGQMKDAEKNEIMSNFADKKIHVLVTTTVVEVGIDVADATTMIIYNSERYGLSQLHQLRGRVGRGEKESYCFLLTDNESKSVKERLEYFCSCSNGFMLAEYDFTYRGAGDFIGTKQHGSGNSFVKIDADVISIAKKISQRLLTNADVCKRILANANEESGQYIKTITLN